METKWIIIAIIAISTIALALYLFKRNQKDKDEVIKFLNESEIEDIEEPKIRKRD
jgi:hypothetical protein